MNRLDTEIKKITNHLSSSKYGYNKKYPFVVTTSIDAIPQSIVLWMVDNLEHGWGWYFEEELPTDTNIILKHVIFSFEKDEEAVLFKLAHRL
jgi:hypothetical protein